MNVSPANGGTITSPQFATPAIYPVKFNCSVSYTLTAVPNSAANYRFKNWSGSVSATTTTITVKADAVKSVTAIFVKKTSPLSLQKAKSLVDGSKDVLVIDVSSSSNFAASHMLCAKNYVWNSGSNSFSTSITNLSPYKKDDILIYEQNGTNTAAAADYLVEQGFESLYYMTDGLDDWIAEGYETFTTGNYPGGDSDICTSLPPMANAGEEKSVDENQPVTLDGSGSSSGVTYSWLQVGGVNDVALSNPAAPKPTFTTPDLNGGDDTLVFQLTVTGGGYTDTDRVTVNVNWNNAAPDANAGPDQIVSYGAMVTLNGSASSDPENSIASYQWMVFSGTIMPTLLNSSTATPSFTAPAKAGWVIYELTVTDNGGLTDTDTVRINVEEGANNSPTADAGSNQAVVEGVTVTLDSSGSTDADGAIASRQWAQTAGPTVSLSNNSAVKSIFTSPDVSVSTALTFSLAVTDDDGATDNDTVTVTVTDSGGAQVDPPAAPTGVAATDGTPSNKIQVTWNASSGADSYDIYRSDMPAWTGATPKRIASSVSGQSYDDTATDAGSRYYYWVKARNTGGVSKYSMFDTGYRGSVSSIPAVPSNVDAEDAGVGLITVSWAVSPGTLVYEVYRANIPAYLDFSLTKIATVTDTTYEDASAVEGSRYYYWVKARNSWGISRFSSFDTGYVGTASSPPAAPLGVTASDGTVSGEVSIVWEASAGAVGYEIWRATKLVSEGGTPSRIGYLSGTSFDDTNGPCGVNYYYWVKARDSWGSSAYSVYDTGFCD